MKSSTSILEFNEAKQESRCGFTMGDRRKTELEAWMKKTKKQEMYAAGACSFAPKICPQLDLFVL